MRRVHHYYHSSLITFSAKQFHVIKRQDSDHMFQMFMVFIFQFDFLLIWKHFTLPNSIFTKIAQQSQPSAIPTHISRTFCPYLFFQMFNEQSISAFLNKFRLDENFVCLVHLENEIVEPKPLNILIDFIINRWLRTLRKLQNQFDNSI